MELLQEYLTFDPVTDDLISNNRPFIEANTVASTLQEIQRSHIIPVFTKDNEQVISHTDFIEAAINAAEELFKKELILKPNIRLSHPIKGRVPSARDKPVNQLLECEKTLYYERMAFVIEIPSISDHIDGNPLSLTIGGVKAYNLDNLSTKKGADEHFKVFIGFQNKVCTNLCVWSDGYIGDLKVKNQHQLYTAIYNLFSSYQTEKHLSSMKGLSNYFLTEQQFAKLIGKSRMYHHLPIAMKADIPPLLFGDSQIGTVVKDYYKDNSFCKMDNGNINLWKLYNLFTGANKSTYIDNFLDRSVNAYQFVNQIKKGLENWEFNWFLN
ncbi:DUF3871 family protein [Chitinophaga polysaccharea]|uniref:DUF3871 family protein n=1 Tax=Chitinophaga polysaccharea TaxID=1293035 RepID=UPI0014555CEB|nr:DUF3871 family protein [Chitinophaga polysaccharea]NLR58162.1 DUF3871 family protein [Chitinophaga polysaccharea]